MKKKEKLKLNVEGMQKGGQTSRRAGRQASSQAARQAGRLDCRKADTYTHIHINIRIFTRHNTYK